MTIEYIDPSALLDPEYEKVKLAPDFHGGTNFKGATHYTRIPSKTRGDGWEDLIYLKKRTLRDSLTSYKNGDGGYVYILINTSWPGIVKIGFTTSEVEKRVSEINNAGSLVDWEIAYSFKCKRPYDLEQAIHRHLEFCRSRGDREFFELSVENAISSIEVFGQYYGPIK